MTAASIAAMTAGASAPASVPLLQLLGLATRRHEDRAEVTFEIMKHGDVVRLPLPGRRLYFTKAPADFRRVLSERADCWGKSSDYRLLGEMIGDGLIVSEGELWRRDRRLIQPLFHQQMLEQFMSRIQRVADEALDRWTTAGEPVTVSDEMTRIAVGVIGHRIFSADVADSAGLIAGIMTANQRHLAERGFAPFDLAKYVPTPGRLAFERRMKTLNAVFAPIIERRYAERGPEVHFDLLSILKEAGISRDAAAGHVRTFFAAGHDTTAVALTWVCHLLGQHPEWQERLAAELDACPRSGALTFADLRRLPVSRAVIEESLRLYPAVPAIGREALEDDVLSGHSIPKGSTVVLCFLAAHRDPRHWPDPERFDPERFLGRATVPWAHLPFGAGPRACLGAQFAMMELQLVLSALIRRFRLETLPGPAPKPVPQVSLTPSRALVMRVHPRRGSASA